MSEDRIPLHVGPAPSAVVQAWAQQRRQLIDASRRSAPISSNADALDLLETLLGLWLDEVDRSETFDWTYPIDPDVLLLIGKYWIDLGELSPEQRDAMGVPRLPPDIEAFTAVVVAGMVDALRAAGPKGEQLLERLPL
jgi:hypothetical protein